MLSKETIKNILAEYMGERYIDSITEKIYELFNEETTHEHNGRKFYVHENAEGVLVTTSHSIIPDELTQLLKYDVRANAVSECCARIYSNIPATSNPMTDSIEIDVKKFGKKLNKLISKITCKNNDERTFIKRLRTALKLNIPAFNVPVMSPSIPRNCNRLENKKLNFRMGQIPATGFTYTELVKLGKYNGLKLGSIHQYFAFLGYILFKLVELERFTTNEALFAICSNSSELGCYKNSRENSLQNVELSGTRFICGVADLASTYKILACDKNSGFYYIAAGSISVSGNESPLARIIATDDERCPHAEGVGWYVF